MTHTIPLILDTDIGDDIDDTWALIVLLKSPEFDIKLITTTHGDTLYRAKIIAKLLEIAHRTDIPIGIGPASRQIIYKLKKWVNNYDLQKYPGKIYEDGVGALISTIHESSIPITVVGIGPLTTIATAINRDQTICTKSRFIGMIGSVFKGYNDNPSPNIEWNVLMDIRACKTVFKAPWQKTITPLDTCGIIRLSGEQMYHLSTQSDPLLMALFEQLNLWMMKRRFAGIQKKTTTSSVLFDTVAIYLALSEEFVDIQEVRLEVSSLGKTKPHEEGDLLRCAVSWKNIEEYYEWLMNRLQSSTVKINE